MKIPDYIQCVGVECGKTDAETEQLWGEFCRAKFLVLESRKLRELFFAIFCLFGFGGAVKVCKWIKENLRISKTSALVEYEHEHVLWHLNTYEDDLAFKEILIALIFTQTDIQKIRFIAGLMLKRRRTHQEREHGKLINFI